MSPPMLSGLGADDEGARVSAAADGGGDDDVVITKQPPSCPVCMEPWTCNGAHRICCIPCGHVYGRSCLGRWLERCGDESAKCPQCSEEYEHELITNLYAPGNLWDGCCRLQELKAQMEARFRSDIAETLSTVAEQVKDYKCMLGEVKGYMESLKGWMMAELESKVAKQAAKVDAELVLMKVRMKKMAAGEEEKAMPVSDLIEFMERNCPLLAAIPSTSDSASPAPVLDADPDHKTTRRRSRINGPIAEPPAAYAVKRRRRHRACSL